jgi:hypothetical protein
LYIHLSKLFNETKELFFGIAKIRPLTLQCKIYLYLGLYCVLSGTATSGLPLYLWAYKL